MVLISAPQEENRHIQFDIDIKPHNEPARLFSLMHEAISSYKNWETLLAPRLILGIWFVRTHVCRVILIDARSCLKASQIYRAGKGDPALLPAQPHRQESICGAQVFLGWL